MTQAAVRDPYAGLASAQVAAWYGLSTAGVRPRLGAYTKQLWSYRHFIGAFASAKLALIYANARLGHLWQVLTPLVNAGVYFLLFGVVLNTRDKIDNFVAFLCIGVFIFGFTQSVAIAGVKSISSNMAMIRSISFPRASLPIAAVLTALRQMFASIVVMLVIVFVTGEQFNTRWLLVAPVLLLQAFFSAGLAMALARLGAAASDLGQLMPFVMRTWMYASGVFYSAQTFAEHIPRFLAVLLQLNPMLVYIELVRGCLLAVPPPGLPPLALWPLGVGWALVVGIGGYVFFWRGEEKYGRG